MSANRGSKLSLSQPFAALLVVLAMASIAQAGILYSHSGQNDPTGEGWTKDSDSSTLSHGNDGMDYWGISTAGGKYCEYDHGLTTGDLSGNWSVTGVVKATTLSSNFNEIMVGVLTGSEYYFLGLASDGLRASASGLLYSFIPSPLTYYTLKIQKTDTGVDAYLDGVKRGSISPSAFGAWSHVAFGDTAYGSDAVSQQWNLVAFDDGVLVPEPGTLALLALALIALPAYARRRRS